MSAYSYTNSKGNTYIPVSYTHLAGFACGVVAPHQDLAEPGAAHQRTLTECRFDDRDRAKRDHLQIEFRQHLAHHLTRQGAIFAARLAEKDLADSQVAGRRRFDAHARQFAGKEFMRQLGQDAGAVAGLAVVGHRAAMGVVAQRFQSHFQDTVAAPSLDVRDETDAAGVVLKAGIIQPLFGR